MKLYLKKIYTVYTVTNYYEELNRLWHILIMESCGSRVPLYPAVSLTITNIRAKAASTFRMDVVTEQ